MQSISTNMQRLLLFISIKSNKNFPFDKFLYMQDLQPTAHDNQLLTFHNNNNRIVQRFDFDK